MFKRWIIVGLLTLVIGVNASAAQDTTTISPALLEQMNELEQTTQRLRELTAKEPVDHQFPTRTETIDYLRDLYSREFPPAEFERLKLFYVALDLLPADIDLQSVYLDLLGSQVAGFYDPDTKTMNVLPMVGDDPGTSLSFTEQVIYVHEFTHALQDQYFDLNHLLESPDIQATPDRSLATTALVEGDATAIMTLYTQQVAARNPFAVLGMLVEGLQAGNLFLPPGIPPILTDELLFPYEDGMDFILALYKAGKWDAVNGAFASPPTTSEQIIHPEKYLAGEGAQRVDLGDASAALGADWTTPWDTTLGEFYLRESLAAQLDDADAERAAEGWGGDHFRVYQDATTGQIAWALRLAWDSDADASEFADLYADYGTARFGSAPDADGCWQDDALALCFAPDASLIASAPTLDMTQALIAASAAD